MLENGVYIIKDDVEIRLFNKTECSDCIRFTCQVVDFMDNGSCIIKGGYLDLRNSIIKVYINFDNPLEYKIEDFVRKYECDL